MDGSGGLILILIFCACIVGSMGLASSNVLENVKSGKNFQIENSTYKCQKTNSLDVE